MTLTAQDRARRIKIVLFDVDGVLTDGTIWLVPGPASAHTQQHLSDVQATGQIGFGVSSATMVEAKGYSAHDGAGITLARLGGMKCGVITKRISETVATRARDLKLEYVYQGQAYKMQAVRKIMDESGVALDEIAYVGDDVIDLPVMRQCGLAIAVANAPEHPRYKFFKESGEEEDHSFLGAPLIVEGRVIGVIHVDSKKPRKFTADEAALLQLVAEKLK